MSALELQVYELLKAKFGEKEAEKFIEYIDFKTEKTAKEKADSLERIVNKDIESISRLVATKEELKEVKVDLVKWMVSLFITLALMIIGLYFK